MLLDQTFYLIALVKTKKCFQKNNNNKKVSYFLSSYVILIT